MKTNTSGQLQPLSERLTPHNAARREVKIAARRYVADTLGRQSAMAQGTANVAMSVLTRGFFGRIKWLLFGL